MTSEELIRKWHECKLHVVNHDKKNDETKTYYSPMDMFFINAVREYGEANNKYMKIRNVQNKLFLTHNWAQVTTQYANKELKRFLIKA